MLGSVPPVSPTVLPPPVVEDVVPLLPVLPDEPLPEDPPPDEPLLPDDPPVGTVVVVAEITAMVTCWTSGAPTPFDAVSVIGHEPAVPVPAVPEMLAVPSPLSVTEMPLGNDPDSVMLGAGNPVVSTG